MKSYTWDDLRKVLGARDTFAFLTRSPERWRKGFALALALLKWEPRRGPLQGHATCALCEYHAQQCKGCTVCPLRLINGCGSCDSVWENWRQAETGSPEEKAAADKLYNLLVTCYAEEYERA